MKANGELKIERGIPVPPVRNGLAETLRKLKVGDSIFVHTQGQLARNAAASVLGAGNYACRKEGDGHRIWRTK